MKNQKMKTIFIKFNKDILLISSFIVFIIITHLWNIPFGKTVENSFIQFFKEMISFIPSMFLLIGLFDVWFPRDLVEKHIGQDSGFKGMLWVIILAMFQAGPLYGAFPVAYLLWKKGASITNIFIYLGAFSSLKIPMLTFEIGFLGLKFSLLRSLITIPVFIVIAVLMERLFKEDFNIKN